MQSPGHEALDAVGGAPQSFGSFRLFFDGERWEWSDEVAHMHGYAPGQVVPTTDLILSHKHPDDAPAVRERVRRTLASGDPFSSRHRIVDTEGAVHHIIVIADRMISDDLAVVGTEGYYIDITETVESEVRHSLAETMPDVIAAREDIDRAKGVLMFVYGVTAERAFDILRWRSQETNVKLRLLAARIVADFASEESAVPRSVRERFDHILLTAHLRVS
ncbi:ANTAR domain-containing protein [Tsukamurella tyrosinosolvens]|nr:PAS and ANTAR domain-containing protein [Tsukamurella tyrosinosolvens]AUN41457.1 transcription antitermination regulator [Tsukamurella tyrosinosolvens]KXP04792.1 transcription antitermination regulator [Tsukamurella tyrosinosolvens]KZL98046.1 transcription antitermination regulator [Tsukamurella tyrosinosolvens]MCA4995307.1 ANTAR domain-containing protein [Tsukamurella tyrosinosolvens]